jgi:hypothetical protein
MLDQKLKQQGASSIEFALLTAVWLPLVLGVLAIGTNMIIGLQVIQVARDGAKLYALGTQFQDVGGPNQQLLARLSKEIGGLDTTSAHKGPGTVIFSAIAYVGKNQCAAMNNNPAGTLYADTSTNPPTPYSNCSNYGHFVFQQRYIVGNNTMRPSNFGAPDPTLVDSNGNVSSLDQIKTAAARADSFNLLPKPLEDGTDGFQAGQTAYVVEAAFKGVDVPGFLTGLNAYSNAVF